MATTKKIILVVVLFFFIHYTQAQNKIIIKGQTYDNENKLPLARLMIINKRTNNGVFADAEGKFSISAIQTDTILFSSLGFKVKRICFKDSIPKSVYSINVSLEKMYFTLKEISIFPTRNLNEIQKDIDNLGIRRTYNLENLDAISSPITYLYERFSKFGKSKRKVAELENEDLKRDILKDLFRLFIKHDIINLNDDEFDAFIKYLNFSDEFMQNATQLELIMAIKGKYEIYKNRWK